jgi:hypothetical protein
MYQVSYNSRQIVSEPNPLFSLEIDRHATQVDT